MATNNPAREKFDPDRDYSVLRAIQVNGKLQKVGSPFDKTLVSTRRLRQMYDQRMLSMNEATTVVIDTRPDPEKMSDAALVLMLEDNGIIPRPRATREWLIQRVKRFLSEGDSAAASRPGAQQAAAA